MYFSVTHMHNYTMHAKKNGVTEIWQKNKQDTFALNLYFPKPSPQFHLLCSLRFFLILSYSVNSISIFLHELKN